MDFMGQVTGSIGNVCSIFKERDEFQKDVDEGKKIDIAANEMSYKTINGSASVVIEDKYVKLGSDETNAIGIGDGTIVLDGKTHISKPPSQIRVNAFWVFNEELLTTIPSTLFNPVQPLIYKDPSYAKKCGKITKMITSFLG